MSNSHKFAIFFALTLWSQLAWGQWLNELPNRIRAQILWHADHEEGNLEDWTFNKFQHPGGGIFNTGGAQVSATASNTVAHSGNFSARATITHAYQAQNGKRAVRLMRWTDRPWDDGGQLIPQRAYYSTWVYFPVTFNPNKYPPWDPGDGGWWNVFQFKANDANDVSQPMWALNVDHDDARNEMSFYLYSNENAPHSFDQGANPIPIPVGRWVHVEALYVASATNRGQIAIWQDGRIILKATSVKTKLVESDEQVVWGIGNYTDHIAGEPVEGNATIYFDDCLISTRRISGLRNSIARPTSRQH